jgi:DNA-binding NarL/FixJ family response regulator
MRGRAIRLLIADDHPATLQGLVDIFDRAPGVQVVGSAGDGVDAVRLAAHWQPDVVLMDLSMPNMDGVEAVQLIRGFSPRTRFLLFSGLPDKIRNRAERRAGTGPVLPKETLPSVLIERVVALGRASEPVL